MAKKKIRNESDSKIVSLDFLTGDRYNADEEKEKNTIGRQIEIAREELGLSRADLRYLVGTYGVNLHRDIVRRWEIGETTPTCYQLVALCYALNLENGFEYFGSLPRKLNKEGRRKVAEYENDLVASGRYAPEPFIHEIEYIDMPLSYLPVSAGTGEFLDEGNYEMISVPKSTVPAGAKFALRVKGDSMEPTYNDGQLVWVQETKELHPGDVGVFFYGDQGYMKSYNLREPNEELRDDFTDVDGVIHLQPVLISYNKKYDPIFVSPETRFEIVGRVLN
ncbi:MAG: LexA family transcriptional regulator [Oscillospiraceae bacterium]|nr:LexA family transcriptional regulator [Oscillospiraceae bacterium]